VLVFCLQSRACRRKGRLWVQFCQRLFEKIHFDPAFESLSRVLAVVNKGNFIYTGVGMQTVSEIPFGQMTAQILIGTKPNSNPEFPIKVLGYEVDAGLEAKTREMEEELRREGVWESLIRMARTWAIERSRWEAEEAFRAVPEVVPRAFPPLYELYLERAKTWARGMYRAFRGFTPSQNPSAGSPRL